MTLRYRISEPTLQRSTGIEPSITTDELILTPEFESESTTEATLQSTSDQTPNSTPGSRLQSAPESTVESQLWVPPESPAEQSSDSSPETLPKSSSPTPAERFAILSKELSNKPKVLFCIGAPAKLWLQNDSRADATANLEVVHGKRKSHTPLVQRCRRLSKSLRDKLNGQRRHNPTFLNETHVVPVFDGEVRNQAVIKIILFIITFYLRGRSRGRGSLHCDRWKDRPSD